MDEHLALIELYEYKVADLMRGHVPRSGRRSVLELRDALRQLPLDAALTRRFSRVDREFRKLRHATFGEGGAGSPGSKTGPVSGAGLGVGAGAGPGDVGEHATTSPSMSTPPQDVAAWNDLHQLLWFSGMQEKLKALALEARAEPGHALLRVIYATSESAERTLRGVSEPFAVPVSDDSLLSLDDREIALQLARALSELLLTPAGEAAVLEALARIQAQPFPRHHDEDVLAARIQSAERENISHSARQELIEALRKQYPQAPDPRERPAVRHAADRLQQVLDSFVASRPLETGVPDGSILYAEDGRIGLAVPPEQATELVIYLAGQVQDAYWHGLHLRWQPSRGDWQLIVNNQLVLLRPALGVSERHFKVEVGHEQLWVYHLGDYVLLRHTLVPHDSLEELTQHAQLTARLLDPTEAYANLRLARAVARTLRDGQVNPEEFAPWSGLRYAAVDGLEMQRFAEQGARALSARAEQLPVGTLNDLLRECARQLNIHPARADSLWQAMQPPLLRLHTERQNSPQHDLPQPLQLRTGGEFQAVQMGEQPLNFQAAGRVVTLNRDYKNDIAVLLPGGAAGASTVLHDLLVIGLNEVSLVLVRREHWIAAAVVTHGQYG